MRRQLLLALLAIAGGGACAQIAGIEDARTGWTGTGTSTGTGGGASCSNGTKDGDETGVDCGGACPACPTGEGCHTGTDCQSHSCSTGGICLAPACDDEVENGDETDTDCGGKVCGACNPGKACKIDDDCKGQHCASGVCVSTCSDGLKGGAESDIDCGGGLVSGCPGCQLGDACKSGEDCLSRLCEAGSCAQALVWNNAYDGAQPTAVAVDGSARVTLTGAIKGACNFGGGTITSSPGLLGDIFVARYDVAGQYLWAKGFPAMAAIANAVVVDSVGRPILAGEFVGTLQLGATLTAKGTSDAFVTELDLQGNPLWTVRLGAAGAYVGAASAAMQGSVGVVVAGTVTGAVDFGGGATTGAGGKDGFVVSLDQNGNHDWSHRFVGAGDEEASGVASDKAWNVYVTGTMNGPASFGGSMLSPHGASDVFLVKLDKNGVHLWSHNYGASGTVQQGSVRIGTDDAGNVVLAGSFDDSIDFGNGPLEAADGGNVFVAKFDSAGNLLWTKHFHDAALLRVNALSVDASGNVLLSGMLKTQCDFGGGTVVSTGQTDAFAAVLDGNGKHVWSAGFGDATSDVDVATAAAISSDKSIVLAGTFAGSISFGDKPLTSVGTSASFLTKLRTP